MEFCPPQEWKYHTISQTEEEMDKKREKIRASEEKEKVVVLKRGGQSSVTKQAKARQTLQGPALKQAWKGGDGREIDRGQRGRWSERTLRETELRVQEWLFREKKYLVAPTWTYRCRTKTFMCGSDWYTRWAYMELSAFVKCAAGSRGKFPLCRYLKEKLQWMFVSD